MAGIEAVTFDLWFTLIAHDQDYDERLREARTSGIMAALESVGIASSQEAIAQAYVDSEKHLQERWSCNRDVDTPQQVEILLKCMGIDASPETIASVAVPYAEAVLHVEPYLVDGAIEALDAIRASGVKLALISNTGRTPGMAMRKVMQRLGILSYFPVTTFSNEAGYLKPDWRIFASTLGRMGTTPDKTVHIGDHQVLDVQGSKEFGMRCIHVTRYAPSINGIHVPDITVETLRQIPSAIESLNR